jgi:hypothetical protein
VAGHNIPETGRKIFGHNCDARIWHTCMPARICCYTTNVKYIALLCDHIRKKSFTTGPCMGGVFKIKVYFYFFTFLGAVLSSCGA